MPRWDADVYLRFANERTQPSIDLIQRIQLSGPRRIIDLGCGPGNSTQALRRRWPDALITGLDDSAEMIEKAKASDANVAWVLADAGDWSADEPFDLVFSNALLHWLPNHTALCRHLFAQVTPGGAFASQLPAHHDSPLHREILAVSREAEWNDRMDGARNAITREPPSLYYDALQDIAVKLDIWETIYYHVVDGPEAVLEWFRGTGLRPFLEACSNAEQRARFEAKLLERYAAAYPRRASGKVLFPFRRLFFVAYKA